MKIETFLNGELVESSEIEDLFIPPNVSGFTTQMLFSPSYIKLISNAQDQEAKAMIQLLALRLELKPTITIEDLEILKLFWDRLVESVADGIFQAVDREQYSQIAESNHMPFQFDEQMKMQILTELLA
jgi:hypothetical protein